MRSSHISSSLLILLVYLAGQIYGMAQVQLKVSLIANTTSKSFSACLTVRPTSNECYIQENVKFDPFHWPTDKLLQEREKGGPLVERQDINHPWESEMYLLIKNDASEVERINVTHLTLSEGTIDGVVVFNSLRITFTLSCAPTFYGPFCLDGCSAKPLHHECHPVTGAYICHESTYGAICSGSYCLVGPKGNKTCRPPSDWNGVRCNQFFPVCSCLNGGVYSNGTCTCPPNWTGDTCEQLVSSPGCSGNGCDRVDEKAVELEAIERRAVELDDLERGPLSIIHLSLIILIVSITLVLAIVAAVVILRKRTRKRREPNVSASLQSSHFLITIDSEASKMLQ